MNKIISFVGIVIVFLSYTAISYALDGPGSYLVLNSDANNSIIVTYRGTGADDLNEKIVFTKPDNALSETPFKKLLLTFPIYALDYSQRLTSLGVTISGDFKYLPSISNVAMFEFIPRKDKSHAWSKIITIKPFIGQKISTRKFTKALLNSTLQYGKNPLILDERYTTHDKYEEGTALIVYSNGKRRELLKVYMASGPYDGVMVQYTILIKSDKEIKSAAKLLNDFFIHNLLLTTVVNGDAAHSIGKHVF